MDWSLLAQFWTVAVMLTLTPGADWAYAIAAGVRAPTVAPSILGMLFGYAAVIAVVALGLGVVMTRYPAALTALTCAGAAYLIWLGVSTLRARPEPITASDRDLGARPFAQFFRGAGVSGINPKGILLLLALLPQFVSPQGLPAPAQILALGSLHLLNSAVVYTCVALLARRILRSKPTAAVVVTRVAGCLMVLLGIVLGVEQAGALLA
jgi:threonine/homoserine/homoserine lactone efflux protein